MAIVTMADAVSGAIASAAEYNKVKNNILDLDARLGPVVSGSSASVRLGALETTVNAAGTTAAGNAALSSRLGTGVTTAAGSTATAQFAALATRATNLETLTGGATSGNAALATRATNLETLTTDTTTNGGRGNDQLASRLGTGIGTGSNVLTGSVTSQLNGGTGSVRDRLSVLEAATPTSLALLKLQDAFTTGSANVIATGVVFPLQWNSAPRNPNTMWSTTNRSRITIAAGQSGLYEFIGSVAFSSQAAGDRLLLFQKNGNSSLYTRVNMGRPAAGGGSRTIINISTSIELVAGDYVELMAYQDSGVSLTLENYDGNPTLLVRRIA